MGVDFSLILFGKGIVFTGMKNLLFLFLIGYRAYWVRSDGGTLK
jgi:hypothetical protein